MLAKRELQDCPVLYNLMIDPEVFPFVRHKAYSVEEFMFLTKQTLEAEERGELVSRTILDELHNPIGTINLFDIEDGYGFLGTWLGKPYFGKGYNQMAKDEFFRELFFEKGIETIFMKIRKVNIRSQKAALKVPYVSLANEVRSDIYSAINKNEVVYDLFQIEKDAFILHTMRESIDELKEA